MREPYEVSFGARNLLSMAAPGKSSRGQHYIKTFIRRGLFPFLYRARSSGKVECAQGDTAREWWGQYNQNRQSHRCQNIPIPMASCLKGSERPGLAGVCM